MTRITRPLLRRPCYRHLRRVQHILNENAVACCRVVDHNVRDRSDELAVLDYGRAAHECVQVGTTLFTICLQKHLILG